MTMETRTQRLKQKFQDAPFELCAERALLWTESQRQSEGQPQVVRNALALKHLLTHMSITIREEELIVGRRRYDFLTPPRIEFRVPSVPTKGVR